MGCSGIFLFELLLIHGQLADEAAVGLNVAGGLHLADRGDQTEAAVPHWEAALQQ